MIKRRLRITTLLVFFGVLFILPLLIMVTVDQTKLKDTSKEENDYQEVVYPTVPVIKETVRVINPYIDSSVTIGKTYYDYKGEEKNQLNSILQKENTYIQNTGIDYILDHPFDVISILEGTVVNVREDDTLGKVVEIKHNNDMVSSYQSLGSIKVKKGDIVTQGQVIGSSGTNELDKSLGNHLHLEIYDKGQAVDPNNYLNKELSLEKGN